ncbi:hypothetical protein LCGC14_0295150 [marine sediment metagenome]|uniref:LamG-like jellyroll fold domain-containing protein n=1 Tax=marine sediment metagenome TaxID=412755 RepID=A0A0F9U957_9ZZZZ
MAWFRVVAVNEDARPLAGVDVEAIDLTDRTTSSVETTNRAGEVLFTDLTGPHFFRARARRTSGQVGGRSFTGRVEIQVVGFDTNCMDFTVDSDGGGTHTTLAAAVADAITAAGASGARTIWLCGSVTEGSIDIGGMGASATIIITSPDRLRVTITAPTSEDIFIQGSTGGNTNGVLLFRNIGLAPDSANALAIYDVNTGNEVRNISFENCNFATAGYILRQDGSDSLGNVDLRVENCTGTLAGFFLVAGTSATFAPDTLVALNNVLTITRWWHFTGGTAPSPDRLRVISGVYTVANGLALANGSNEYHWKNLVIFYTGSGVAFSTAAGSASIDDITFDNIVIRFDNSAGTFGDFGSAAINNNDGLYIKNIYGYPLTSMDGGTTFITVDTDYLNVHVGNSFGNGFATQYSGLTGVGDDHGLLTGLSDDDHTQYVLLAGRSGGQTIRGGTAARERLLLRSTASGVEVGRIEFEDPTFHAGFGGHYYFRIIDDTPGGFWRLGDASGDLADSSGNGNTGSPNGGITYGVTGTITGDSDDAITLNGTTGYISATDKASLDLGDGPFTLEAWIKKAADGSFMTIIAKGSGAYQLRMSDANTLQLLRENTSILVSSTSTTTGTGWHHVVATKTGATVLLYIDGVDVTGAVTNDTMVDTNDDFHIGRRVAASDEFFNGSLDEVAVYPTVLTATQVLEHYNAGVGDPLGIVSRVNFDTGDFLDYSRTNNFFSWAIGQTEQARLDSSGQLQLPITGSGAGIVIGGDAQWYRSAADTLRTPDAVVIDGALTGVSADLSGNINLVGDLTFDGEGGVGAPASLTTEIKQSITGTTPNRAVTVYFDATSEGGTDNIIFRFGRLSAAGASVLTQFLDGAAEAVRIDHTAKKLTVFGEVEIDGALNHDGSTVGFYGTAPIAKPAVTGARDNPEGALADLLTELANLGLITDSSTAS